MTASQPLELGHPAPAGTAREEVWLLGQPPLQDYIDFAKEYMIGGDADPRALCDEWRAANDYYYGLEDSEAGLADTVECRDLDPVFAPFVEEMTADPRFRRAFDTLPASFAMVELDRLIVSQPHITLDFTDALQARLGPSPSPEALFRFCLPIGGSGASVQMRRSGRRRYVFTSDSADLRFHEATLLRPEQVSTYVGVGPVSGIVGLVAGFGSNLLNVIRSDNRLVLQNGYHRAYALRALGITHAPCVVQTVTRRDELALVGDRKLVEAPVFYFKAKRPPLLKDFFDPRIRKVLPVRRIRRVIEVSFEVREFEVAE